MATIVKRENNNSIVYKFQVKYKDRGSGKVVVKSTTWTPPPKMTAKQAEREAVIEAMKYENKIKEMVSIHVRNSGPPKSDTALSSPHKHHNANHGRRTNIHSVSKGGSRQNINHNGYLHPLPKKR
ncbi:MAG: hypothetical protein R3Y18_05675 [Bacillota bacterium]